MKDYYAILGVDQKASGEEIKKVYRKLAVKHHPDHGGDEERFKEINEAYSILSDPHKRQRYDMGDQGIMDDIHNIFKTFVDPWFGGHQRDRRDPNRPMRGKNLQYLIEVPLKYFILGGSYKTSLRYKDVCTSCNGSGAIEKETCEKCKGSGAIEIVNQQNENFVFVIRKTVPCDECGGKGFKAKVLCEKCKDGVKEINKEITLEIPAQVRDGHVLVKEGEGLSGLNGGPPGNLLIKLVMVLPDASSLTEEQIEMLSSL